VHSSEESSIISVDSTAVHQPQLSLAACVRQHNVCALVQAMVGSTNLEQALEERLLPAIWLLPTLTNHTVVSACNCATLLRLPSLHRRASTTPAAVT
jgi:hypothetical protein